MLFTFQLAASLLAAVSVTASADSVSSVGRDLDEVVVSAQSARTRIAGTQIGAEKLELTRLKLTPVLFGERDIIKSITLLPGVHSEGEGSGGFEVRGGTASQNLVTLDGLSLYNPAHVMGIFSTFNDDALGRATLYKGPIPPAYGDGTSSVLDVGLSPGDMERWHASGTIGILAAKARADGPVIRDRLSVAVTARRSYVDMFLKMVPRYRDIVMHFYDLTAKVRYMPSPSDIIDLSAYVGRDNMAIDDVMSMKWGNAAVSANWSARRADRWSATTTAAFTSYTATMGMSMMQTSQSMDEYIRNLSLNERITLALTDNHSLEWGLRTRLLAVKSAEWRVSGVNHEKQLCSNWANSIWAAYSGHPLNSLAIEAGLRFTAYTALPHSPFSQLTAIGSPRRESGSKTYLRAEPRASVTLRLTPRHSLKAGAGVTSQDLHSLRSSATTMPFDRYAIASASVRPLHVTQYSLAYTGMTPSGDWEWSAEGYYKTMRHVYDYRDGRSMLSDIDIENIILGGRGRSFGAEFMLRRNSGPVTGWVSYTLSRTLSRISGINDGRWYVAPNDRRHNVTAVAIWPVTPTWTISATWQYSSGTPLTVPDVKYQLDGGTCYYYSARNSYRTPATHHLDLSATYTHTGPRLTYQWALGIYNLYNRYNPFIIYFQDDPSKPSGTRAVQRSLYGIVPSVSYTLRF